MVAQRVFTFDYPQFPRRAYLDASFLLRVLREEGVPPREKPRRRNLDYFLRLKDRGSDVWTSPLGLQEVCWQLIKPVLDTFGHVVSRIEAVLDGFQRLEIEVRVPSAALTLNKDQWLAAVKTHVVRCEVHPADALHLTFAELGESDGIVSNDAGFQKAIHLVKSPGLAVYAQFLAP